MVLAVIDFDGTLFPGNSMPYIWKKYGEMNISTSRYIGCAFKIYRDRFLYRQIFKDEAGYRYQATAHMFNLFVGMNDSQIQTFFSSICDDVMNELNQDIVSRIEWHKANGHEVVLLSGGFEKLLEMIGLRLGISRVKATPFVYNLNGKFMKVTKKDPLVTMNGEKKRPYLEKNFANMDWSRCYAYADNITDQAMLALVGHPVAVKPDEELKQSSIENGWTIMA